MDNNQLKKIKLKVHGMHCASCEVLVERKFKKVSGIEKVSVDHASGQALITCSQNPDLKQLNEIVKQDGYSVSLWQDRNSTPILDKHKNTFTDYLYMGWIFLIIVALYYILKQLNFLPSFAISEHMNYGLVFVIGLFAAISSCIAVVGGLLLAMAGKYNESHPNLTGAQKFKPHIYFNVGRIVGYTIFGALVGGLGSIITLSSTANGYLIILVSVVMLFLGFQLLHLFPGLQRFTPKIPKFISHRVHNLSEKGNKGGPFTLGALTFFLPCGFTQAFQLYVLTTGDWKVGALTMLVFSLGTMPALVSLSAISSFVKGTVQKHFLRFAGVMIVMLAIFNINNGLALAGYNFDVGSLFSSNKIVQSGTDIVPIVNGKQIVKMKVSGYNYFPNKFTVVEGVPVEWQIDGINAAGCGRVLVVPSLGMNKYLSTDGITTVTFTPTQTGNITFNCSMGMMTRGSQFTVIPNTKGIVGAKIEEPVPTEVPVCDPKVSKCPETQKLNLEVSNEKGIFPRTLTAKKGIPVELTIDDKVALGGCMSIWVLPKYNLTIPMTSIGIKKSTFTPTTAETMYLTCSMGSKLVQINIID